MDDTRPTIPIELDPDVKRAGSRQDLDLHVVARDAPDRVSPRPLALHVERHTHVRLR